MKGLKMNNVLMHYAGYVISIAQHKHDGVTTCQEIGYWKEGGEVLGDMEIRHYITNLRYFVSTAFILQVVMEDIDRLNSLEG